MRLATFTGLLADGRRRTRPALGPLLGALVVVYFAYHAVQGDRGLVRWWQLNQDIARAEDRLENVSETRGALRDKVALLKPDQIDPDMLEERARMMLNMGWQGDLIIFTDPEN